MLVLNTQIRTYLDDCRYIKGLSEKTIKAYSIDLRQFESFVKELDDWIAKSILDSYIKDIYINYKPRSAKRKIACIKAFFHYLELEEILEDNPFHKIKIKHKESISLPKTIPVNIITKLLHAAYADATSENSSATCIRSAIRNVAVIELLFSTGMRVNELCKLKKNDVDLKNRHIKVNGKGSKERYIYITNESVMAALKMYQEHFIQDIECTNYFFINSRGTQLSEQSVRFMIKKYEDKIGSNIHITPHMFRHTVATLLLEEDVDIRYIQELLGHSSITTTQIYTHISLSAQKRVLKKKHPRNKIKI